MKFFAKYWIFLQKDTSSFFSLFYRLASSGFALFVRQWFFWFGGDNSRCFGFVIGNPVVFKNASGFFKFLAVVAGGIIDGIVVVVIAGCCCGGGYGGTSASFFSDGTLFALLAGAALAFYILYTTITMANAGGGRRRRGGRMRVAMCGRFGG